VTAELEWEYGGYLFGAGHPFGLTAAEGLDDVGDLRDGSVERARAHGRIAGPLFASSRTVTLTGLVRSSDMRADLDVLAAAFPLSDVLRVLSWRLRGTADVRRVYARVRRRSMPTTLDSVSSGVTQVTVQFDCPDPRVYSDALRSGSTGVGSVTGGLSFPHGFPHGFGLATPGTVATTNVGSVPAPWVATLTGPLTSPRVSLPDGGGDLRLAGFVLGDGQTLVLDSAERTVMLGSASRYGALTLREWFHIPVGGSSVALGAASGTGSMSIEWRDTWL